MTLDPQHPRIKPKAFAVIRRGDAILVGMGTDEVKGERFGRIVGGGIEFGETAAQAVVREVQEEFGITVQPGRLLGWIENIFTYNGVPGHEINAVYEVTGVPADFIARDDLRILDCPGMEVAWLSAARMAAENIKLYPTGLAELIWRVT